MKQILQDLRTGTTRLEEVPTPFPKTGELLIATRRTIVSAGTERMLVGFGRANLVEKARQQPDKVRMVLDKIKTDGLVPTLEAVQSKLDQPLPLGYCNVGRVLEVGKNVAGFEVGDRVASNGKHAEVVSVPKNLCVRVPDDVGDDAASFTVIGSIALQGIRLVQPTLGEVVVVTGLGLIGQITVQLLKAQGCRVLGIDFDEEKLKLARRFGAATVNPANGEDPLQAAEVFSRGRGVDAVIITASTKSNEPVHQAARMCRKRGRIVLVGVVGLKLSRADFFEKELTFQVSCSYGPGRYDPAYEEDGNDYPVGLVRWTEQRNFEAVLDMLAEGRLDVEPLISHRFKLEDAEQAYEVVGGTEPSLGILLDYARPEGRSESTLLQRTFELKRTGSAESADRAVVGVVGSGNYATQVLIPAFKAAGARMYSVASSGGVSGVHAGWKHGFQQTTTDTDALLADSVINTIVVTTRHDSHARFVLKAIENGKHVFVEKPLCLTADELDEIERTWSESRRIASDPEQQGKRFSGPLLMVGFNRRFSPLVVKAKELLEGVREPKSFIVTVNAGAIPPDHWTQNREVGGGRIIGEACHFIDLLHHLAGSRIAGFHATCMGAVPGIAVRDDKASFTLSFDDGSFGTVHYLANGHKSFPKERLEVFAGGRVLQLDNFRSLRGYGWPGFRRMKLWRQDKGQRACAAAFISAVEKGLPSPIPFEDIVQVTQTSFDIANALLAG